MKEGPVPARRGSRWIVPVGLASLGSLTVLHLAALMGGSGWAALIEPLALQRAIAAGAVLVVVLALREWELAILASLVVWLPLAGVLEARSPLDPDDPVLADRIEDLELLRAAMRHRKPPGDLTDAATPSHPPGAAEDPGHGEAPDTLRLLVANVLTSNRDWAAVLALVEAEDPDLVALLEVDASWMEGLEPLSRTHRLCHAEPRGDNFGIALWSRLEGTTAQARALGDSVRGEVAPPAITARVPIAEGPLRLYVVHTRPPVGRWNTEVRNTQLAALRIQLDADPTPAIVVGDLNATPWCAPLAKGLLHRHTLVDARRSSGAGLLATWPAALPAPLRIPIDHVLHDPRLTCTSLRLGPSIGSDHLPLIADLQAAH